MNGAMSNFMGSRFGLFSRTIEKSMRGEMWRKTQRCGDSNPWRGRSARPLEALHFRSSTSVIIMILCFQRLRRPVLRKGFAFPEWATDFISSLRLRLNPRGGASPKKHVAATARKGRAFPQDRAAQPRAITKRIVEASWRGPSGRARGKPSPQGIGKVLSVGTEMVLWQAL